MHPIKCILGFSSPFRTRAGAGHGSVIFVQQATMARHVGRSEMQA